MEYLPIILTAILSVLAFVLVVVGVYVVQVLQQLKRTLQRVNDTLDIVEAKVEAVSAPFHSFGNMASSLGTGLKIFETFVGWLHRDKKDN